MRGLFIIQDTVVVPRGSVWVPEAERGTEPGCLGCPSCMLFQNSSKTPPRLLQAPRKGAMRRWHHFTFAANYHTIYDATTASGSLLSCPQASIQLPPRASLRLRALVLTGLRSPLTRAAWLPLAAKGRTLPSSLAATSLWGVSRTHYGVQ